MINHTKKNVHSGAKIDGIWTVILKNLSQLFGACFWCDSSAKSFLDIESFLVKIAEANSK